MGLRHIFRYSTRNDRANLLRDVSNRVGAWPTDNRGGRTWEQRMAIQEVSIEMANYFSALSESVRRGEKSGIYER